MTRSDNAFDGFAIDKVYNAKIINNIAHQNGRHGINVCTGSENILVSGNNIKDNGFFHPFGLLGNGITVQSNKGLTGDKVYITKNVEVKFNVISGSAKDGIQFKLTESCSAISNEISVPATTKACVAVLNTFATLLQLNTCELGIPLNEFGNLQLTI